jgi:prevent-host-death family protein
MIVAGIKEVKNNLSRLLARVKAGEEVLITERGKPVARIMGEPRSGRTIREALSPLIENGLITLPSRSLRRDERLPVKLPGKPVSEMVLEDRR